MDLWQILVLGVVALGLDADWDRLEHIAKLTISPPRASVISGGVAPPTGRGRRRSKVFVSSKTLRGQPSPWLDGTKQPLLPDQNAHIAAAGTPVGVPQKKKERAPSRRLKFVKVDTYVFGNRL